jgi:hypothetical protein
MSLPAGRALGVPCARLESNLKFFNLSVARSSSTCLHLPETPSVDRRAIPRAAPRREDGRLKIAGQADESTN